MPSNSMTYFDGFKNPIIREEHTNDLGQFHREDGPAIICETLTAWCLNGVFHREDGPAIEDGNYKAWFLHGVVQKVEHVSGNIYIRKVND
jgi:hypothetical protein